MKERQKQLLKLLSASEEFISVRRLAEELKVSEKTLRRDMESINRELEPEGAFIERRPGLGIRLSLDQADKEAFLAG